jgi:preprotein translocase subunit SecD
MNKILKDWRILMYLFALVLSLLLLTNIIPVNAGKGVGFGNGLDYGLDFAGGTQLQLRMDGEVSQDTMAIEKGILENRLNSLGLKDIPVRPWGNQYLLIQIAGASPAEITDIENILQQQARFEERISGELAVTGDEISLDLSSPGSMVGRVSGGYTWAVHVNHNPEGACRFGKVADGKMGKPVDIFIDRPQNTSIVFSNATYGVLASYTSESDESRFFYSDTAIDVIANRSVMPVFPASDDLDELVSALNASRKDGINKIILAGNESELSEALRNRLEEAGFATRRMPQDNKSVSAWITELTGMQSSPRLNFNTRGECVYSAQITGTSATLEAARKEVKKNQVLLTSGNLPAKLSIESRSTTPPTLGRKFLRYSFYTGIIAVLSVAFIIFVRYQRRLFLVLPISLAGISEIIILIGLASLINWQLDLPAVAGIIAAVGTGVDHFIIITDETLKRSGEDKKKLISFSERIRRAFFIVFSAAATMVAAMIPLFTIGAGMLKGFAFTTVMGVFIGVGIVRPAYARVIRLILE